MNGIMAWSTWSAWLIVVSRWRYNPLPNIVYLRCIPNATVDSLTDLLPIPSPSPTQKGIWNPPKAHPKDLFRDYHWSHWSPQASKKASCIRLTPVGGGHRLTPWGVSHGKTPDGPNQLDRPNRLDPDSIDVAWGHKEHLPSAVTRTVRSRQSHTKSFLRKGSLISHRATVG